MNSMEPKTIKGFDNYEVTRTGNIISKARYIRNNGTPVYRSAKVMKPVSNGLGYLQVSLVKEGIRYRKYVHVLVAEAFLGSKPKGLEVNHKDRNKSNNHVDNLEYISHRENVLHWVKDKKSRQH